MKLNLTPLARHEAYLRLYSILTSLPIAKSAKKNDEDLKLERKLAAELIKNWRESYSSAMKDIFAAIPAELSAAAAEIIENGLLDALGTSFGSSQAVREQIKGFITKAYHETKNKFKAESSLSLADVRAINILSRHNCFWLGEHYGKHIGPKVSELTQKALDEGLGRDALAENLRQELGGAAPENYSYWDVAASAALVRARSFGAISGMEEAGITEYEILAMNDERMCPICGEMNGKHFSVAKTREVIDKVLDITAPEKFKDAMPWQSKPPTGKSEAELLSDGQSLPPFHGRCRCTLVMVSDDSIEQYGDTLEEQALHINEFNKGQKINLLSKLAYSRGQSYTKDKLRSGEEIYRDDAGRPIFPPNGGAKGEWSPTTLNPGDTLIDRYGNEDGFFLAPEGTPFEKRALPSEYRNEEYHKYEVKKAFVVDESIVLAWFEQPGEGKQYKTRTRIKTLLNEYLEEVFE